MGWFITIVIAVGIFAAVVWTANLIGTPPPDAPDPDNVTEVDVGYLCTVCGLRLTVTHAQDDTAAAPRHCREEMIPV